MSGKILIIDDQAVMLKLMAHPLQQEGYTIVTAMTGAEGLQKIQGVPTATIRIPAPTRPTRWSWSPNGSSSARWIWIG
jgi:CheY-like chemotaxis protein